MAAAFGAAAALLEWAGWRILWRHGGGPPVLDATWSAAFLAGVGRTLLGALGAGAALSLLMWALAAAKAWEPALARRRVVRAFVGGAASLLAFLGALTLWAP